eukprot:TRINITY_DN267_c0_g1_i1.p1 TRINITY_DN267_c0_g1~~TRINITY_DN267_c0_g1_i1.p1  ORF type:complete len:461 (-),score=152.42 TRINITY_DN267_c0_g1_i1:41-1423(-)
MSYYNTTTQSSEPSDLQTAPSDAGASGGEVEALRAQIAQLEKKLADKDQIDEQLNAAKRDKQEALDQVASVRKEANQVVDETEEKLRAAQAALDEKTKELSSAQEQLSKAQGSSSELDAVRKEANKIVDETEEKLRQAQASLEEKTQEVDRLTKELSAASASPAGGADLEKKDAEIAQLKEWISKLEESKKQAESKTESLNDEVHAWEVKYQISEEAAKHKSQEILDATRAVGDLKAQLEVAESSARATLVKREGDLKDEAEAAAASHAKEKAELEARLASVEEQLKLKTEQLESTVRKEADKVESADLKLEEKNLEIERMTRLFQSAQVEAEKLRSDAAAADNARQAADQQAKVGSDNHSKQVAELQASIDRLSGLVGQRDKNIEKLQSDLVAANAAAKRVADAAASASREISSAPLTGAKTSTTTTTPPSNALTPAGLGLGFVAGAGVGLLAYWANKK